MITQIVQTIRSNLSFREHWVSFIFLLPFFPMEAIYHSRIIAERVHRANHGINEAHYDYHLTAFTTMLGSSLFWVFWGGTVAFVIHAVWIRNYGRGWFWSKLLFLPVYFVVALFWSFHTD